METQIRTSYCGLESKVPQKYALIELGLRFATSSSGPHFDGLGLSSREPIHASGMKFATRHKRGEVCNWCAGTWFYAVDGLR
jgi:hypothetical protein